MNLETMFPELYSPPASPLTLERKWRTEEAEGERVTLQDLVGNAGEVALEEEIAPWKAPVLIWSNREYYVKEPTLESKLLDAVRAGKVEEVKGILETNLEVTDAWDPHASSMSALRAACDYGQDGVVKMLLGLPHIDINHIDRYRRSPFFEACRSGSTSCVRLLLADPRLRLEEEKTRMRNPVKMAMKKGHLDVIRWWIASGRELYLGVPGNRDSDVLLVKAMNRRFLHNSPLRHRRRDASSLLEKFRANRWRTREEVRVELGWYRGPAGVFALVVFVCDDLLAINLATSSATRFFRIAQHLPLELQMMVCLRVAGSMKTHIRHEDREAAFKDLAQVLLQ